METIAIKQPPPDMPAWQYVWRNGVIPHASTKSLEELLAALIRDDSALIQDETTQPIAIQMNSDKVVKACCALGYLGWKGEELITVGEVERFFADLCMKCGMATGEPGDSRYFLNWCDETPREEMRVLMIQEIQKNLADRKEVEVMTGQLFHPPAGGEG